MKRNSRAPSRSPAKLYLSLPILIVLFYFAYGKLGSKKGTSPSTSPSLPSVGSETPTQPPYFRALVEQKLELQLEVLKKFEMSPKTQAELLSQWLRWFEKQGSTASFSKESLLQLLDWLPADSYEEAVVHLIARAISKFPLDEEMKSRVQAVESRIPASRLRSFQLQVSLSSEFPSLREDPVAQALGSPRLAECLEGIYFLSEVQVIERQERLLGHLLKRVGKLPEACQVAASKLLIMKWPEARRSEGAYKDFLAYLNSRSGEAWAETQLMLKTQDLELKSNSAPLPP